MAAVTVRVPQRLRRSSSSGSVIPGVTIDRARENLRTMPGASLEQVVNAAVNQTLARTMITGGTTFLAVLVLFLFGGDVLQGFAFAMLVGITSGTYSTVFIAGAIAVMLSRRSQRSVVSTTRQRAT